MAVWCADARPFEPKEIAYYASEVARGLHYLHRNKIFHRDIKSANILVDGDEGEFFKSVKLCDFNISTYRSDAFSRVGTPRTHHNGRQSSLHHTTALLCPFTDSDCAEYMAPELLNNTEGRPIDTEKADSALLAWPIHERLNLKLRQLCVVCVVRA